MRLSYLCGRCVSEIRDGEREREKEREREREREKREMSVLSRHILHELIS